MQEPYTTQNTECRLVVVFDDVFDRDKVTFAAANFCHKSTTATTALLHQLLLFSAQTLLDIGTFLVLLDLIQAIRSTRR